MPSEVDGSSEMESIRQVVVGCVDSEGEGIGARINLNKESEKRVEGYLHSKDEVFYTVFFFRIFAIF